MLITEIHHRDGTVTVFTAPPRPSAARTAAVGAVASVLLGAVVALAFMLSGCGDLDPCSCKCREPYVRICPVNGTGTCGCAIPYYKITAPHVEVDVKREGGRG